MKRYLVILVVLAAALLFGVNQAYCENAPEFDWAKTFGGASQEIPTAGVLVDSQGNVIIAGTFARTVDFNPDPEETDIHTAYFVDIFITKFYADGTYAWTRTYGCQYCMYAPQFVHSVTVDHEDNILVSGDFIGTVDFDPTEGVDERVGHGSSYMSGADGFVTRLHPDGTYGGTYTFIVPDGFMDVSGAAVDKYDNLFFSGSFRGTVDFDPTDGQNIQSASSQKLFVTKINLDGTDVIGSYGWTLDLGNGSFPPKCAVDSNGNVYIAGDGFLKKVNSDGTASWEDSVPQVWNIAIDLNDNIFVTGYSNYVPFVQKFDNSGSLLWSRAFANGKSYSIATTPEGDAVVIGYFGGTNKDFDPGPDQDLRTSNGDYDVFVTKFDADGSYLWTHTIGGTVHDEGWGVAVDSQGSVFVTGDFGLSVDFDPGAGEDSHTSNGDIDVFLLKFKAPNHPPVLNLIGAKTVNEGEKLTFFVSATDPDEQPLSMATDPLPAGAMFFNANDVNHDGIVNQVDEDIVQQYWTSGIYLLDADVNRDGVVDVADRSIVHAEIVTGRTNWLFEWTPGYNQAGVYSVMFTAIDGDLATSETIIVTVNNSPICGDGALDAGEQCDPAEGESVFDVCPRDPGQIIGKYCSACQCVCPNVNCASGSRFNPVTCGCDSVPQIPRKKPIAAVVLGNTTTQANASPV